MYTILSIHNSKWCIFNFNSSKFKNVLFYNFTKNCSVSGLNIEWARVGISLKTK